jgi:hypothetical protein
MLTIGCVIELRLGEKKRALFCELPLVAKPCAKPDSGKHAGTCNFEEQVESHAHVVLLSYIN